jgi:lipid A 3-O-deacylase
VAAFLRGNTGTRTKGLGMADGWVNKLRRSEGIVLLLLLAGTTVTAQAPYERTIGPIDTAERTDAITLEDVRPDISDPVADVRNARSWEYGPFVNFGNGFGNRDDFRFFSDGFQLGKPLSQVVHARIFSGQFEYAGNIMPLWLAFTPPAGEQTFIVPGGYSVGPFGGGTYVGVSLTPVIFRWNFLTRSRRFQPWFQAAGGLIYTTHKFPPDLLVPHGDPGGTSVWNFSPQGGGGFHYFISPKRSIDLGVNGVHISSASLGDRNPGVNASIQIQVGYTFWK